VRSASDKEGILQVMHKVAESMAHEEKYMRGTFEKRSRRTRRTGEHRKAEIKSLMKLLSQNRELRESDIFERGTRNYGRIGGKNEVL
jgi:hypothetical protein